MDLIKDAPIVKVVMLKGKDGAKSALSELENDMTFLTREEITTLVNNIVSTGSVGDIDTGFVTRIKELNKNKALSFWVGTQAEYDAIATKTVNTFYIITDDSYKEDIAQEIADINTRIDNMNYLDVELEIGDLQNRATALESDVADLNTDLADEVAAITQRINDISDALMYSVVAPPPVRRSVFRGAGYISEGTTNTHKLTFNLPLDKYLPENTVLDYDDQFTGLQVLATQGNTRLISRVNITADTIENHGYFLTVVINGSWSGATINKSCDVYATFSFKIRHAS